MAGKINVQVEELLNEIYSSPLGQKIRECLQCGVCSGSCPTVWGNTPRKVIALFREEYIEPVFEEDTLWMCTSCYKCSVRCPSEISISDLVTELRSKVVEGGFIPKTVQDMLESTFRNGNPWGGLENKRTEWCKDLSLKDASKGETGEVLYFVGCTPSYDTRNQEVAKAIVNIFRKANVDFFILGNKEKCCGDGVLKLGEKGLFEMLAEENIANFEKYNVKRMVTTSPHSFNVFKKEYKEFGGKIEVQHYTQFIWNLIKEGKLKIKGRLNKKVTYHDPCFLGRHNGVYDEPRNILKSIPGLQFVEMRRNRENSYCCGGGGGRIWMEEPPKERPAVTRAKEAAKLNPDIIVTACPFCLMNLTDAVKVIGKDEEIEVKDLAEVLNEVI